MVATYAKEFGSTGRRSTGVFQTLLAGKTAQPAMVCAGANRQVARIISAANVRRSNRAARRTLHSSVDGLGARRQVAVAGRRRLWLPRDRPAGARSLLPTGEDPCEPARQERSWLTAACIAPTPRCFGKTRDRRKDRRSRCLPPRPRRRPRRLAPAPLLRPQPSPEPSAPH